MGWLLLSGFVLPTILSCTLPGIAGFDAMCPTGTFMVGDEIILTLDVSSSGTLGLDVCAFGAGINPIDEATEDPCFTNVDFDPGLYQYTVIPASAGTITFEVDALPHGSFSDSCTVEVTGPTLLDELTISDGTLDTADWTISLDDPASNWTVNVSNPMTGGNPGSYRQIEYVLNTDQPTSDVWVRHMYNRATADPGQFSAINAITISMEGNTLEFVTSLLCYRFVIVQGSSTVAFSAVEFCSSSIGSWAPNGPRNVDLTPLDLSPGGAPLEFGFDIKAVPQEGIPGSVGIYGIDNFLVEIN